MYIEIFFLALALSVDAMIVSFSCGLLVKKNRGASALKLAAATALGQTIMPVIGWLGAQSVHLYIEEYDHWIAFIVFLGLGSNVIYHALTDKSEERNHCPCLDFKVLFLIGVATSIDACVAGISLYFMDIWLFAAVLMIGLVTFINSLIGFYACRVLKKIPSAYMEILSGLILIGLGAKILTEHLSA